MGIGAAGVIRVRQLNRERLFRPSSADTCAVGSGLPPASRVRDHAPWSGAANPGFSLVQDGPARAVPREG